MAWTMTKHACVLGAFLTGYAVFLGTFYIPVLLLLLALIFRGVAFEFRALGVAQLFWGRGFVLGSLVAAFAQGAAVGAMIRGIPVVSGQFYGGSFDWVAPLPIVCLAMRCLAPAGRSLSPKMRCAAGRAAAYRCLLVRLSRSSLFRLSLRPSIGPA